MKLGNLYNLKSVDAFVNSAQQSGFTDSAAGVVLARNLTAVDPKLFEKRYPELALLNAGITLDNTGGYARRIQSLRVIDQGDFEVTGDHDDNKGKISIKAEDSDLKVYPHEGHSIWSDDEVKEADLQNINLPAQYLATHNKLYNRKLDEIGLIGLAGGQGGLLNTGFFQSDSAGGTAETRTAKELYDEIAELITAQNNQVNNTPEYKTARVIMPVRVMNVARSKILDTHSDVKNVLEALKQNFPEVEFLSTFRADTIANGGNLATSSVVAFSNNEEAMKLRIPVPLTIGEIVKPSSFVFRVDSKFRIAGLDILETTAGTRLTGL